MIYVHQSLGASTTIQLLIPCFFVLFLVTPSLGFSNANVPPFVLANCTGNAAEDRLIPKCTVSCNYPLCSPFIVRIFSHHFGDQLRPTVAL